MAETMEVEAKNTAKPWTVKILEILSDGQWHKYADVRDEAARLVPPSMAFRKAEANRVRHYVQRGNPIAERKYGSREDTVLSGQRAFVNKTLSDMTRQGRIEAVYGDQPKRKRAEQIRLTPSTP